MISVFVVVAVLAVVMFIEACTAAWILRVLRKARGIAMQLDRANVLLIKCDPHVKDRALNQAIFDHFNLLPRELDDL